jgi:hypothetical protein
MTAAKELELDARDRILGAAAELFYRDGILATGVDALIDRANVARRMRLIAMGTFMNVRVERSQAPIETARASAIGLLAVRLDTTPPAVEERLAGTTA